jgi:hypothetical protein
MRATDLTFVAVVVFSTTISICPAMNPQGRNSNNGRGVMREIKRKGGRGVL